MTPMRSSILTRPREPSSDDALRPDARPARRLRRTGTLWVPDKELDTIFRLDPATGRVLDSFAAGDGAYNTLRAFGSMWVTSYAGADVWRFTAAVDPPSLHGLSVAALSGGSHRHGT